MSASDRNLKTYLRDHDAGSLAGLRMARQCESQNQGTPAGAFAARLVHHIEQDRIVLQEVLARVGGHTAPLKQGAGRMVGVLQQLKLRRPGSKAPLARFELLEALVMAIHGRGALWKTLDLISKSDPRLANLPFSALADRSASDMAEAETHRLRAARSAFGPQLSEHPAKRPAHSASSQFA